MEAVPVAAPAASAPTPAQPAAVETPAARPSTQDLIAAATKAMTAPPAAEVAAEPVVEAPPLPATPESPATTAVLEAQESASALIRQRNELADARKNLQTEQAKWRAEQSEHAQRVGAMERAFAEFEADPAAFARARGTKRPLAEIARDLYLEEAKLDDLPEDQRTKLQAQRDMLRLTREHQQLRNEVQQAQVQQRLAQIRAGYAQGINEISAETPLVKHYAGKNPGQLVELLMSMAGDLAVKSPELGMQTVAQLAARLEPALANEMIPWEAYYESKYKAAPAPAAAPPPAAGAGGSPKPPPESPTLSPSLSTATPARSRPQTSQERIEAAVRAMSGN